MQDSEAVAKEILEHGSATIKVVFIGEQTYKGQRIEQDLKKRRNMLFIQKYIREQLSIPEGAQMVVRIY